MLVLDTNVLSELMRPQPAAAVAAWAAQQSDEHLFTTTICRAEIASGIVLLPQGRRRRALEMAARDVFEIDFEGRVLPFDLAAAEAYADVTVARRNAGLTLGTVDLFIAAIVLANRATIVTRDVGGFQEAGVPILNPWDPT